MRGPIQRAIALLFVAVLSLSACTSKNNSGSKSVVVFGELMPYSGASAFEGAQVTNGCLPAKLLINQAGGILGHQVTCQETDTRGDAVDAVPAANKMIATTSNLIAVLGPSTAEAPSTVPILSRAKLPMWSVAGDPQYDSNTDPFFYRLTPSDNLAAAALAVDAKQHGYTRIGLVFTSGGSAQANVPPLVAAAKKLGLQIVSQFNITPGQASYSSEVANMLAKHPEVILNEGDPQSMATFFSNLQQAGGLMPIIVTAYATDAGWQKAVESAIGNDSMARYFEMPQPYAPAQGAGWQTYQKALVAEKGAGTDPSAFSADIYARTTYDACIVTALAMTETKSTDTAVYNAKLADLLSAGSGKTVVTSYAEGLAALQKGETIQFVGAGGDRSLNQFHNVTGTFEIDHWDAATKSWVLASKLTPEELAAVNG
jgi:ABC-type branched-subunit amino acid transport system substrate-binding protein